MRLPKKITVLGCPVRIVYIKSWDGHKDAHENLVGRLYPDTMTIYINSNFSPPVQKKFLIHELGHAVLSVCGADQTLSPEMQEVIVQSYAEFLFNEGQSLFKGK